MPRLYRRRDGGYYLKGHLASHGAFVTWQVTDAGVRLLRESYRLPVDLLPCEVPAALCRELILQGLAYTQGSGITGMPSPPWSRPAPTTGTEPLLALREDETDSWYLELLIPEVPARLLAGISASALLQCLQTHRFSIESIAGTAQLPALDLWPGRGGAACPVLPQTDPYVVGPEPRGEWLPGWQLGTAPHRVPGLAPDGTVFAGIEDGGVRLAQGEPVVPGHSYYLVAQVAPGGPEGQARPAGLPSTVACCPLGTRGAWQAWQFTLPNSVDAAVRDWCAGLGHPLEEPPWRLVLLAPPPHRYLADGVPVLAHRGGALHALLAVMATPPVSAGIRIVVEQDGLQVGSVSVTPPHVAPSEQTSACYLALPLPAPGRYRLRAASGRVAPLRFAVEDAAAAVGVADPAGSANPNEALQQPPALTVCIAGSEPVTLHAFTDGEGPHEVTVAVPPSGGTLVTVNCVVPVDIAWSYGQQRRWWSGVPAGDVPAVLQAELVARLSQADAGTLTFDAGTFGRIGICPRPLRMRHAAQPAHARAGAAQMRARVRWLARTAPALVQHAAIPCLLLPKNTRRALLALAETGACPEAAALAAQSLVPLAVWPHVQALVRECQTRLHELRVQEGRRTPGQRAHSLPP